MSGSTTPVNIDFSVIPASTLLVPGVFAELDPQTSVSPTVQRALLIGNMLATGTAIAGQPVQLSGGFNAASAFGVNSLLATMASDYRLQDGFGEVWALPQAIPTTGTAPTATLTFTGPATAAGNIFAYIAGQLVQSAVSVGDTATMIASNWVAAAAPALLPTLPVTVAAVAGVVTLTAVDRSVSGSDVDLRLNYLGAAVGQVLPAGVTAVFSVSNMSTGAVANPSIASSLALLGSMPFDFIISGLNDLPNMQLITSLLNDQTGRWSFLQELFGHTMAVSIGNISTQTALAAGLNDQHASIFGAFGTTFPAYRCAADLGGSWAVSTRANPALPVQNIPSNIPAPAISAQFDISDRQTALSDGVATIKVVAGATVLERMVTTNTTSVEGVPSAVYRDVETLDCLTFIIRDLITYLSSTYGRKILVADGTPIPAGSFQCTAQIIKADIIGRYQTYVNQGIAQDFATFAATALAQNQGNGVVALQLPINVANQLRVLALQVDFTKS